MVLIELYVLTLYAWLIYHIFYLIGILQNLKKTFRSLLYVTLLIFIFICGNRFYNSFLYKIDVNNFFIIVTYINISIYQVMNSVLCIGHVFTMINGFLFKSTF